MQEKSFQNNPELFQDFITQEIIQKSWPLYYSSQCVQGRSSLNVKSHCLFLSIVAFLVAFKAFQGQAERGDYDWELTDENIENVENFSSEEGNREFIRELKKMLVHLNLLYTQMINHSTSSKDIKMIEHETTLYLANCFEWLEKSHCGVYLFFDYKCQYSNVFVPQKLMDYDFSNANLIVSDFISYILNKYIEITEENE
jgi:hypothetical protein